MRLLALGLVIGLVAFVAFYLVDRRTDPGPTLAQRTAAQTEEQVRKNPNDLGIRLRLAAAYLADNRTQDALRQYDAVLAVSPENVVALMGKAGILRSSGDPSAAAALYQKVVDIRKDGEFAAADTDLERAFYSLGSTSNELGRYAQAIAALESAVRIDRTDADSWYELGVAQLRGGTAEQAVSAERNAVVFVPLEWADPYAVMEQAYTKLGKTANAAWAHAMIDLVAKRYPEARSHLQPLVSGPAAADASLAMGFVSEAQGDAAAALGWYRKALVLDPKNTSAASGVDRLGGASAAPAEAPSTVVGSPAPGGS